MFSFFTHSSLFVRVVGNLTLLALVIIVATKVSLSWYESDKSEFIKFTSPPVISNGTTLEPQTTFAPGDSFAIEYHFTKYEIGCFAEYINFVNGPVSIQFPGRKSRFLDPRGSSTDLSVNVLLTLPTQMPAGTYDVQLVVYPTCDGISRDAFIVSGHDLKINVQ